jgi:outer membrane immunogenic protein
MIDIDQRRESAVAGAGDIMRGFVCLGVAAAALSLGLISIEGGVAPAQAADMPRAMSVKAPAVVAAPYSWSGFYIGGQAGYGWGGDAIRYSGEFLISQQISFGNFPSTLAANPRGFIGGATWGMNWQSGRIVLGLESDFSFSAIKRSETRSTFFTGAPPIPYTHSAEQKLAWFSTTRVRAGVTVTDNLLAFVTGGLASGQAEVNSSHISNGVAVNGCGIQPCPVASVKKWLWGWAAGGGLEYGSGPWSIKAEYLHYDLGSLDFSFVDPVTIVLNTRVTTRTKFSGDIVRVGVNYRFNWETPVVARY